MPCTHLDQARLLVPEKEVVGCEACLLIGSAWLHLRMCQTCGVIGCCDSSPYRHAGRHSSSDGHPILRSVEPGENWSWCVIDEVAFVLPGA
jgi:hypothetical protein